MIALLDIDDVLADFTGGYCRKVGVDYTEVIKRWPEGEWSMLPALGAVRGLDRPLTVREFWDPLEGDHTFWEDLELLPWMAELVELVRSRCDDVHLLSSPSHCDSCYNGKVKWIKRHFGREFNNFMLTPHKELLAGRDRVLIDDREANIKKFREHGGLGITFPRPWNALDQHDPVGHVAHMLKLFGSPK